MTLSSFVLIALSSLSHTLFNLLSFSLSSLITKQAQDFSSMERSTWPKNLSSSRKHAIKELLHGQNPTKKVRDLFDAHSQAGNNTGQPLFPEDLVVNVLRLCSNTLSESMSAESNEVLQVPSNACVRSEVSKGSESIKSPVPRKTFDTRTRRDKGLIGNGRQWGKSDRKSILNFKLSRRSITRSKLIDDGYQWREYVVKLIHIPNSPGSTCRKYYRCAHRIDQGCKATKLVRKTSHGPLRFRITYKGQHTCENHILKLNPDSSSPGDDSIPLSFNTSLIAEQDDENHNPIFFDFLSVNQQQKIDQGCQATKLTHLQEPHPQRPGDDSIPLSFNTSNNNPIFFNFLSVNQEQKLPSEDGLNPHGHSHDNNSNNNNIQAASSDFYASAKEI